MKFSIIVPTYNLESYIDKCIESVLSQTFQDYELIIIDDASSDKTVEKIKKYVDKRIKLLRTSGFRVAGLTRNEGLNIAQGEYLLFLDGDDWYINPQCLEILNRGCIGEDIIYFNFGNYGEIKMNWENRLIYGACWNKAWRREFFKNLRFNNVRLGEDLMFLQDALAMYPREKFYPETIVYYNYPREGSICFEYIKWGGAYV